MTTLRWLLPFTWGVDMAAIDSVVHLAQSGGISLVAVSLVSVPDRPGGRGARLEHIQQSKDFLEAVQFKAARLEVPVERYEVFTGDVLQSIALLVQDLRCDGIVLVSQRAGDVLLRPREFKRLLLESCSCACQPLPQQPRDGTASGGGSAASRDRRTTSVRRLLGRMWRTRSGFGWKNTAGDK